MGAGDGSVCSWDVGVEWRHGWVWFGVERTCECTCWGYLMVCFGCLIASFRQFKAFDDTKEMEDELGGAHLYGWRKVNNVSTTDVVWRQRESCSSAQ
jgi:hypothetical protein